MAKNSIDAYGAIGKTNLLTFAPDALTLVEDERSPLFDRRVFLPVNEALVRNIMHRGVVQPIVVAKNTETGETEVVAGRQRVKAAREANKRLIDQGLKPLLVPAVPRREDGKFLAGLMVSENEQREDDTPIGRAEKMARLFGMGYTEAEVSIEFGCSPQTVKNTLALLTCCADVRKAVADGSIGAGHALKLSRMSVPEQRERLGELMATGDLMGHAKARKQRQVVEPNGVRMKRKSEIEAERDASTGLRRAALDWVLGTR